ncbi:hypothetical protein BLL42_26065 [Pseudomonas frederiksbergensis]|uniref:Uncharacterized protein n=1 Tax=Pseudomonas frederiksbergensis TaxID=104087 RepID=A0A1J0ESM7_9PSED|nr:hypothetical protein BLL42_26065 [Pseudomonas frederiksbergensis]
MNTSTLKAQMNTPVACSEDSEAAALGAAIQAAWCASGTGIQQSLLALCERCVSLDHRCETQPVVANVTAYQPAYEPYRQQVATL